MDASASGLHGLLVPATQATRAASCRIGLPWDLTDTEFPYQGTQRERLRFLLHYAQFAPSPYNTQPWLFRLQADAIEILADRQRTLAQGDPAERQLWMSTGALVVALRLAGGHFGFHARVHALPAREVLARVEFSSVRRPDMAARSLFLTLPKRRRHVAQFDPQAPSGSFLAGLAAHADQAQAQLRYLSDAPEQDALRAILDAAYMRRLADPAFCAELECWLRGDAASSRDGIPQTGPAVGGARPEFGAPEWSDAEGLTSRAKRHIASSWSRARSCPVVAVLATSGDAAQDWLAAGSLLMELELISRASGVWLTEFNDAVELPDLRRGLQERMALPGYPQTVIGLGYGAEVPPLPRRPVDEMLLPDHSPEFAMH
jgi:nitroreductase